MNKVCKIFSVLTSDQELYKFNMYYEYGKLNIVSEDGVFNIFLDAYKKEAEGKYTHHMFIKSEDSKGCFLSIKIDTIM